MRTAVSAATPRRRLRVDPSVIDARFLDMQGVPRQVPWLQAAAECELERCRPVRSFPVRPGRRIAPGWWWSATDGHLVHYGFGAMRTQVMLLDFDRSVTALACSPLELVWWGQGGRRVSHVPHLMARLRDGSAVLVDCAGRGGISRRLAGRARVMEAAAAAAGWHYRIAGAPDPVLAANVRWLAGFRHPRHMAGVGSDAVAACFDRPRPLVEAVQDLGDPLFAWPAVFHALWTGVLRMALERPLCERAVAQLAEGGEQ
ncbi:TnsA-like heteromeric transposase endonuclease subunit [Streptomyces sp. NPDC052207]|uniref:TnsA-like heteromeric transposase endonuclease subunit n=1 Tax=Streptomyces sp. NPDC052207 TaxID=3155418 RepID=UPI0034298DCE